MSTTATTRRLRAGTTSTVAELPDELVAVLKRMQLPYLRAIAPDVLATAASTCRVAVVETQIGWPGPRRARDPAGRN